ncbi:MAG: O-sialoglycoprotein endopeptidase [Firmicutes bacterium]|nr:O-sialoglycoprotein endopeptidase [Bacillota bacterium]
MSNEYFLGVDTSNYTTSLAVVDKQAKLTAESRKLLPVEKGKRGFRQSEALFWHVQNLPNAVQEITQLLPGFHHQLRAVAVSVKPRPRADSYMPVFLPGKALAQSLAALLEVPYYDLSHQENHIWAGLVDAGGPKSNRFIALHLSGGTSEILDVYLNRKDFHFKVVTLGGTTDLHAGQFIDRVGVAIGLPFPAGTHLEKLALESRADLIIPSFHRNGEISFAGPESAAMRMLEIESHADIARAVLLNISRTVTKLINWAAEKTGVKQVLLVGGVCANLIIRQELQLRLPNLDLYFAAPGRSVDNAFGAALFCGLCYRGESFFGNFFE